MSLRFAAVVMGASAGGVGAMRAVLAALPADFPIAIAVAQHVAPESRVDINLVYGSSAGLAAIEAEDKAPLVPGQAAFAPPGYHLLIERGATYALSVDEPVRHARPSIDVLFESAARVFGARAVAVLMTGANDDGAAGLRAIKQAGGRCLVQDPDDAEYPTMPMAGLRAAEPDAILPLSEIAGRLSEWAKEEARGMNG